MGFVFAAAERNQNPHVVIESWTVDAAALAFANYVPVVLLLL